MHACACTHMHMHACTHAGASIYPYMANDFALLGRPSVRVPANPRAIWGRFAPRLKQTWRKVMMHGSQSASHQRAAPVSFRSGGPNPWMMR